MIIPPAPTSHSVHPASIFPLLFSRQKALGKASENGHFCPQMSSLPPLQFITCRREKAAGIPRLFFRILKDMEERLAASLQKKQNVRASLCENMSNLSS